MCPWCSTPAPAEATRCPACDAALAQREDLGGLLIPGVTAVDPVLADAADRPLRIQGGSPSQAMGPTILVAAAMGGPLAVAALGTAGTVVAAEWMGASRPHAGAPETLEAVGRPSESARTVADRLDREAAAGSTGEAGDPAGPPGPDA